MKTTELKIKRKSLAAEARIIRTQEAKAKAERDTALVNSLNAHRTHRVRRASRYAHLAHAFMTGKAYKQVEQSVRPHNDANFIELAKELQTFWPGFTYQFTEKEEGVSEKNASWVVAQRWLAGEYMKLEGALERIAAE